ncbi:MAG: hypothetical protein VKL41_04720 [Snowella sp.]|nr:hypothetical protein [Snowella sp.]
MQHLDYDSMTDEEFIAALKLDEEERALLDSIESGEWISVPNVEQDVEQDVEQEIQRLQAMAREQIARQKIEVNLSMQDTNKIYDLAEQFQKPVANLAQEIIHRYLGGELVEKV